MPHFLIIYYQFQLKSRVSLNPSIFIMELTVDALYYQLLAAGAIVIFFVLYSYLPIFWYFGVLNIFTAAMYGLDKISAQFGWWRVSEEFQREQNVRLPKLIAIIFTDWNTTHTIIQKYTLWFHLISVTRTINQLFFDIIT